MQESIDLDRIYHNFYDLIQVIKYIGFMVGDLNTSNLEEAFPLSHIINLCHREFEKNYNARWPLVQEWKSPVPLASNVP